MAQACVLSDVVLVGDDKHTTHLGNLFFLPMLVALAVPNNLNININNWLLFFWAGNASVWSKQCYWLEAIFVRALCGEVTPWCSVLGR